MGLGRNAADDEMELRPGVGYIEQFAPSRFVNVVDLGHDDHTVLQALESMDAPA
jgi:hypothetical protein